MMEGNADPWTEADHLAGGSLALERLGHSREEVWAASAGYDNQKDQQVLVFGFSNVEILSADGDVLLDAGHREVRGIRRVEDSGIEVCVTGGSPDTAMRPRRWVHRISNQDARYLEELWLTMSPITHSGIGLNPLHWREDEYAYFVGRVVTEAAKCDVSLAELVMAGRTLLGQRTDEVQGESGKPLAKMLTALGNNSPAIAEIAERYDAWYDWRNFAVHGVRTRDSSGRVTERVVKVPKFKKSQAQPASVEVQEQDFQRLALAWHAFYMLNHDAWSTRVHIPPAGAPEQVLEDLPMSNSVSPDKRLPPAM